MKLSKKSPKSLFSIYIYGILIISAVLPAFIAVKNIRISPDSMMYSLVSQEILSGNGISLPIIYDIRDNLDFTNGTTPFFLEPPLFPIILALFGGVSAETFFAAQMINVLSHVVIAVFTFLLMQIMYPNRAVALLTSILVSTSLPLLNVTHYILSDALCIAITVAAVYFLVSSRFIHQGRFNLHLLIASICTSAAVMTRSAGASLIPVFFYRVYTLIKNKNIRITSAPFILTILLPIVSAGFVYLRAYAYSGSLHGWVPPELHRSYIDALKGTAMMIPLQFHLGKEHISFIAVVSFAMLLYLMIDKNVRREIANYMFSGLDCMILFIISHIAMVTYAMANSQTVFESRFVSPLVPFMFLLSSLIIVVIGIVVKRRGFSKLSLCWTLLIFTMITSASAYKSYVNSNKWVVDRFGHYRILQSDTYKWIKGNIKENTIITTNRPFHLSFFGGYSTIRLPHNRFEQNAWVPDDMETYLPGRMSKLKTHILALFEEADVSHEGRYVARLFHERRDDENFILLKQFTDGVVYKLKD